MLRTRVTGVWLLLVAATVVSWAVGEDHGVGSAVAVVVLGIAAVKFRFVGLEFMVLRHAPVVLRAIFEAYCVVLWSVLAGLYWWS